MSTLFKFLCFFIYTYRVIRIHTYYFSNTCHFLDTAISEITKKVNTQYIRIFILLKTIQEKPMIKILVDFLQHKTQNIKVKTNIVHKISKFCNFSFYLEKNLLALDSSSKTCLVNFRIHDDHFFGIHLENYTIIRS